MTRRVHQPYGKGHARSKIVANAGLEEPSSLPRLSYLALDRNALTGTLPASWATRSRPLTHIFVQYNQLTGGINSGELMIPERC